MDACYAGAGRDGGDLLPGKRFAIPSYAPPTESRWIEWSAAQPNELSGPLEAARHGAFTWAVVGALRGWADGQLDGQPDGTITLEEADLYVGEVLRAVEVHDQRPALQAKDRTGALVRLPAERSEPRPDPAALKKGAQAAAATPAPVAAAVAAAPAAAAPVASANPGGVQHWGVKCTPVPTAPEAMAKGEDGVWAWALEPGVDMRATWVCKEKQRWMVVNRFPPAPGKSVSQMMVDNLTQEVTRTPGHAPSVKVKIPGSWGSAKDIVLTDPETWPATPIMPSRGALTARLAPIERKRAMDTSFSPFMVVEDDRQHGAIWVCRDMVKCGRSRSCAPTRRGAVRCSLPHSGIGAPQPCP